MVKAAWRGEPPSRPREIGRLPLDPPQLVGPAVARGTAASTRPDSPCPSGTTTTWATLPVRARVQVDQPVPRRAERGRRRGRRPGLGACRFETLLSARTRPMPRTTATAAAATARAPMVVTTIAAPAGRARCRRPEGRPGLRGRGAASAAAPRPAWRSGSRLAMWDHSPSGRGSTELPMAAATSRRLSSSARQRGQVSRCASSSVCSSPSTASSA